MNRESVPGSAGEQSLVQLLLERARAPDAVCATHKVEGRWVDVTWGQVLRDVRRLSAGLVTRGVRPGDRVAIFAATSLQWVVVDLAITAAQGITVPIYASNTPDECRYILDDSDAVMLVVDSDASDGRQAGRLTRVRHHLADCASVRQVVVFDGAAVRPGGIELPLTTLMEEGARAEAASPGAFERRVAAVRAEDPCCFLYTSGTTGPPKGVILTHGNWGFQARAARRFGVLQPDDCVLLFLPLAHAFAQVVKAAWLAMGFRMAFAESVEQLAQNLGEVRPTILPAVPRVFEKVYRGVLAQATAAPGLRGMLARWAFRQFDAYAQARLQGRPHRALRFRLARRLVFDARIRPAVDARLGGRMRLFVSGGAPLSRKIAYFFDLLGFEVLEGYGLTETTAGATVNPPGAVRIGTVGRPFPGTELRIAPDGEVLVRGPHVMRGYHKDPVATAEVLEPDGWFHTGDIGELDAAGYLRITDRKKDLIVTAGGKNVAPQNLENALKAFPLVSQAMVHGDRRPYLVALVCVSEEAGRALLADRGVSVASYAELARRPELHEAVAEVIQSVNAEQPPHATLKAFALMDHDFTQESGELTPTLKVKRKLCTERYRDVLDRLYQGERVLT